MEEANVLPVPTVSPPVSIESDIRVRPISLTPIVSTQQSVSIDHWFLDSGSGRKAA